MFFLHALVFAILATFSVRGNDVVERLGVPGPLRYRATSFDVKWTHRPAGNYYVQEYVPPGESLDFVVSDAQNGNIDVVEFNVHRYSRVQTSDKNSVVLVLAYAVRAYADEIESFLSSLGSVREERIKEMICMTLPQISIAK